MSTSFFFIWSFVCIPDSFQGRLLWHVAWVLKSWCKFIKQNIFERSLHHFISKGFRLFIKYSTKYSLSRKLLSRCLKALTIIMLTHSNPIQKWVKFTKENFGIFRQKERTRMLTYLTPFSSGILPYGALCSLTL